MFPHFIQRFFAARSDKALLGSMAAYPFVALLVFLPMTALGVLGATMVPGLSGAAADGIFTKLAGIVAGPVWGPVFALAALAALMSTMDSQLLSCASIVAEDFLPAKIRGPRAIGIAGLALAAAAWLVSLKPPATILGFLNATAFPGYASLAPVALAAIYAPAVGAAGAALTLCVGTLLVLAQSAKLFVPPIPAPLFNAGVQFLLLAGTLLVRRSRSRAPSRAPSRADSRSALERPYRWPVKPVWTLAFVLLGVAGIDFWSWNTPPMMLGVLPVWMWYQVGIVLIAGIVFAVFARISARQGRAA